MKFCLEDPSQGVPPGRSGSGCPAWEVRPRVSCLGVPARGSGPGVSGPGVRPGGPARGSGPGVRPGGLAQMSGTKFNPNITLTDY